MSPDSGPRICWDRPLWTSWAGRGVDAVRGTEQHHLSNRLPCRILPCDSSPPLSYTHCPHLATTSHFCTGHPTPGQRRERTPKKGGSGGSQWSWADLQLPWLSLGGATPYDLISLCSAVFSVLCNKRITSEIRRINKTYYALKYHRRLPGVRSSLGFLHTCKEGWPAQLTPCPSF